MAPLGHAGVQSHALLQKGFDEVGWNRVCAVGDFGEFVLDRVEIAAIMRQKGVYYLPHLMA